MIERFIDWVATLPPEAIYAIIGVLGFLENVFPPVPADSAIALGALLSMRDVTSLWMVFGITVACNLAGAMGMYWVSNRNSTAMFESRTVRRLLPAGGMEFVRKEYQRFGLPGLFIARLLPGFRAVVPPFAGLIHLPAWRVSIVLLAASAVWYGGIIYIVGRIGEHWNEISHLIGHINVGLGIVSALAAGGIAFWIWRRLRRPR